MAFVTKKAARLEDPGAELLDRMTGFWDQYGRVALAVAVVVVAAGAIGVLYLRSRASTEARASGKLAEAEILFWQGYYPRSYDEALKVIKDFPGTESAFEAHRLAGDDAFWRDAPDYRRAAEEYRAYLAHRKTGMLADGARRSLAAALEGEAASLQRRGAPEAEARYRDAASTYEGLVGKMPDRESSAEFLLSAARCYRRINQPQEAARRLQRVIAEYGETASANRARVELAEVTASAH